MKKIIQYTLSPSPFLMLLGLSSVIISVAMLTEALFLIAIVFLLLSMLFFIPKRKFQLDLIEKKYCNGMVVFGYSLASWKSLPEQMNYLSIIPMSFKSKNSLGFVVPGVDSQNRYKEIVINIIYKKRKRLQVCSSDNMEEITKVAKQVALHYELNLVKRTYAGKEWVYWEDLKKEIT